MKTLRWLSDVYRVYCRSTPAVADQINQNTVPSAYYSDSKNVAPAGAVN